MGGLSTVPADQERSARHRARPVVPPSAIKPNHKAVSRTLGYALTSASYYTWRRAASIFRLRLNDAERGALAWAVLKSLEPQQVDVVAKAVLGGAGYPLPSFMDADADAQFWADLASPAELRAFAFAAFRQMSRHDQVQFMRTAPWGAAA